MVEHPGGVLELGPQASQQVLGVVWDPVLFQKLPEFLFEGPLAMMLFLCGDILPHRLHHAGRNVPAQFFWATPISSRLGSDESGTLAGVQGFSCAVARRSPPP